MKSIYDYSIQILPGILAASWEIQILPGILAASWENRQKQKTQISFAVTTKLISAFVFATWIVQFLFYLNPKFQASSSFLCLYRPVCVGPFLKPHCWFSDDAAQFYYLMLLIDFIFVCLSQLHWLSLDTQFVLCNLISDNKVKCIPPLTLLLYRKTGVCRGIPNFLIFDSNHTLWVLIRTASMRRSNMYPLCML